MDSRLKQFPPAFLQRLKEIFPPGVLPQILHSYVEPKPLTFRVNTLKSPEERIVRFLKNHDIVPEKDPFIPLCYYIQKISRKKFESLDIYRNGEIYVQSASSQIPTLILNPGPEDRVLDVCASPGGKTTQMAAMMGNSGTILALEPDTIRFQRLKHNLKKMGCENVFTLQSRGQAYCKNQLGLDEFKPFTRILVDAPCSGDGTFSVHNRKSHAHWSEGFIQKKRREQIGLLHASIAMCAPGGLILYSTCSTAPEENESVVDEILGAHHRVDLLPVKNRLRAVFFKDPLPSWKGKKFSDKTSLCSRIYPSPNRDGFFMALLKICA